MKYYSAGQFAALIGIHIKTLQKWDRDGILKPERRTPTNRRQYSQKQLEEFGKKEHRDGLE